MQFASDNVYSKTLAELAEGRVNLGYPGLGFQKTTWLRNVPLYHKKIV